MRGHYTHCVACWRHNFRGQPCAYTLRPRPALPLLRGHYTHCVARVGGTRHSFRGPCNRSPQPVFQSTTATAESPTRDGVPWQTYPPPGAERLNGGRASSRADTGADTLHLHGRGRRCGLGRRSAAPDAAQTPPSIAVVRWRAAGRHTDITHMSLRFGRSAFIVDYHSPGRSGTE